MELGDSGRASIKGHDLDYYLKMRQDTREKSLAELRRRDDAWLMVVDDKWPWGPTNNYCKWFSRVRAHLTSRGANRVSPIAAEIVGTRVSALLYNSPSASYAGRDVDQAADAVSYIRDLKAQRMGITKAEFLTFRKAAQKMPTSTNSRAEPLIRFSPLVI